MKLKHFYFIKDDFFILADDPLLMLNKNVPGQNKHSRPCFFAIKQEDDIYWLIPISSRTNKFHKKYDQIVKKEGKCDTIVFGRVLGYEKAFLIQNMFPITSEYIENEYIDKFGTAVSIKEKVSKKIIGKAKRVLALHRLGVNVIYPDVDKILAKLRKNIK